MKIAMGMGMVGPSQEAIDSAVDFQGPRKRRGTVGSAFNWDLHWLGRQCTGTGWFIDCCVSDYAGHIKVQK